VDEAPAGCIVEAIEIVCCTGVATDFVDAVVVISGVIEPGAEDAVETGTDEVGLSDGVVTTVSVDLVASI
jgi:hypothetical protein